MNRIVACSGSRCRARRCSTMTNADVLKQWETAQVPFLRHQINEPA
ncbi:hypothetical protein [Qaidamihabitans albus]|nr:hypothetical protein [Qaidamihabitans albus]